MAMTGSQGQSPRVVPWQPALGSLPRCSPAPRIPREGPTLTLLAGGASAVFAFAGAGAGAGASCREKDRQRDVSVPRGRIVNQQSLPVPPVRTEHWEPSTCSGRMRTSPTFSLSVPGSPADLSCKGERRGIPKLQTQPRQTGAAVRILWPEPQTGNVPTSRQVLAAPRPGQSTGSQSSSPLTP